MRILMGCMTAVSLLTGGAISAKAETVTVGLSSAFSGAIGFQGPDARKGIELAIKQLKDDGSPIDYKLVIADDECTPAGGASAFRNLLEVQQVDVILGSGCSGATLGGMPALLEGAEVSAITYGSTNPKITSSGNPFMWRMNLNDATIAKSFSRYILDDGVKSVHILSVNNDFGRGAAEVYQKSLPELGVDVKGSDFFTTGTADLRSMLSKIAQDKPDAVLFFGEPPDCALLVRQKRELNIDVKLFSRGGCYTDEALHLMGDPKLGDGLTEAAYWARTAEQPMVEAFKAAYGDFPAYNAALAYYAMLTVNEAVKAGGASREGINKGLATVDAVLDIGPIKFDETHQAYPNLFIVRIEGGESKVLKTITTH